MPTMLYHMDEPVAGPGLFPQYIVSRLAARHVKVCLGGQGGDEIFGGYVRYLVAYFEQAIKGAIYESNEEAEHVVTFASIVPNLHYLRQYVPMLQQFWRSGMFEDMDRRYFTAHRPQRWRDQPADLGVSGPVRRVRPSSRSSREYSTTRRLCPTTTR